MIRRGALHFSYLYSFLFSIIIIFAMIVACTCLTLGRGQTDCGHKTCRYWTSYTEAGEPSLVAPTPSSVIAACFWECSSAKVASANQICVDIITRKTDWLSCF